jgi:hypothetical protein
MLVDGNTGTMFFDPYCVMHPNAYNFNNEHYQKLTFSNKYTNRCDYNNNPIKKIDWPFLRLHIGLQKLFTGWLKRWKI